MAILQQAACASGASRSMKIASAHKSLISRARTRHFHGSYRAGLRTDFEDRTAAHLAVLACAAIQGRAEHPIRSG